MPLNRQNKKRLRILLQVILSAVVGFGLGQLFFKKKAETSPPQTDTPTQSIQDTTKNRKRHISSKEADKATSAPKLSHSSSQMLKYLYRSESFSSDDFADAIAAARYNKAFENALTNEWARRFPGQMFEHVFQELTFPKDERRKLIDMALEEWTKQAPQKAIARLKEIPETANSIYHVALHRGLKESLLFDEAIELEATSAMTWWAGVDNDQFFSWYDRRPADKLAKVLKVRDDGLRQSYLSMIALHSAKQDLASSIQRGISLPRGDQKSWLYSVVSHVSEEDPVEALNLLTDHITDPVVLGAASPALRKLLLEEPETALNWADQHLVGNDRVKIIESAFSTSSSDDWEKMQSIAANLDPGPTKNLAYSALAKKRINNISDAKSTDLAEWITNLEDPDVQREIIQNEGYNIIRNNFSSALLLTQQNNSDIAQKSLLHSVYSEISRDDPEAAKIWLQNLPERNRNLIR